MHLRPIFAALVALAATPALHAQSFTLAGRNVDIPVPPGFCVADESQAERPIVERIRYGIGPNNRMLLVAAPCDQLAQLRALEVLTAEAGFDDYAVFTVLAPDGEIRLLERYDRPGFVRLMREGMGDGGIVDDGLRAAQERLRHLSSTDQRLQSLGVLGSDASGVYFGLVATRATADGRQKDYVVYVGAATLVKDPLDRRRRPLQAHERPVRPGAAAGAPEDPPRRPRRGQPLSPMKCPHCATRIGLFSPEMKTLGRARAVSPVRRGRGHGHPAAALHAGLRRRDQPGDRVRRQRPDRRRRLAGGVGALVGMGLKPGKR